MAAGTFEYRVLCADAGTPERVTSSGQIDFSGSISPIQNGDTRDLRSVTTQTTDRWGNALSVSDKNGHSNWCIKDEGGSNETQEAR